MATPRPTVWFIQHADTGHQSQAKGQQNIPLSPHGQSQSLALAGRLAQFGVHPRAIFSSDLSRAYDTARLIGSKLGSPVIPDRALRPWDIGSEAGNPVGPAYRRLRSYFSDLNQHVPPPGSSESFHSFAHRTIPRVRTFLHMAEKGVGTLALVTHKPNLHLIHADVKAGLDNPNLDYDTMMGKMEDKPGSATPLTLSKGGVWQFGSPISADGDD